MNAGPSSHAKGRGSACCAVNKQDLHLTEHHVPILTPGNLGLDDSLRRQLKHLPQGILIGKAGPVLDDLSELPIQALNNVGRMYDSKFPVSTQKRCSARPSYLPSS